MHSIAKGDVSTAMITARCLCQGYIVLRPVSELSRYDLVIDRGNGFERVQCKTGRLRQGAVQFNACSSLSHHGKGQGRSSYSGQIELFGIYCRETDEVYLLPVEKAGTAQGSIRVDPPKNNQLVGVNMAIDYRL